MIRPLLPVLFILTAAGSRAAEPLRVDFRYAPPEWQTAICLPDDPHKSLVDRSGELLYDYRQGGREFGTRIKIRIGSDARWQKQQLVSPRVPIVQTYGTNGGLEITQEAFACADLGKPSRPLRADVVLVHVRNTGETGCYFEPRLIVDTAFVIDFHADTQCVVVEHHGMLTASLPMAHMRSRTIYLKQLHLAAGATTTFCVVYSSDSTASIEPITVEQAIELRDRAVTYWEKLALPYGRVHVPDAGIQALIDSSIRNIWQAREIKDGLPAFQVGPTCYRGLWIVDGAFLLEAATLLGAGDEARSGVAYEMKSQRDDGRIEVMKNYHKENGIVLWTCIRHARLTQDKAWLESMWPRIERVANYIEQLRAKTLANDSPRDDGLIPAGFPDGGIGGVHEEYTNVYWNLVGLRAFAQAAKWLGKERQAAKWQKEYDDFLAAFRRAAARDMRHDQHGNQYLPIRMDGKDLPQRGQWAFCHAVYPGQLFAKDDPLVTGNLAMLKATEREGMVYGTGWDATGIWNYFASFYGHAWLWQGDGQKAAQVLYAFANHAAPLLVWREEQSLKGGEFKKVGDMPHNWASAEFIRLATHLLALDRGSELHLFEGLPAEWTQPGMVTRLDRIATPFGPLTMALQVSDDGKTARLTVAPLSDPSCQAIVVHLAPWARAAKDAVIRLDPRQSTDRQIPLRSK